MKALFVFGTRPEAIKFAPLIKEAERQSWIECKVCITSQHRQMLDQVMDFFEIKADYDLDLMSANQTLFDITERALKGLKKVYEEYQPNFVFVQGDTTTTFVGALAAYYLKIKVVHFEAGLRSFDKYSPFPEEMNRSLTGRLADFHFTPTDQATQNLKQEGSTKNVWQVGNTVIDALHLGLKLIDKRGDAEYKKHFSFLDLNKKIILVTGHRRESFGKPFENICDALKNISQKYPEVQIVYPVHLNPNVKEVVHQKLADIKNVHLIAPLEYPYLLWLMKQCYLVITDSGGIQEEAPAVGKPVLVMRDVTERQEGVDAGTAKLVGTDADKIFNEANLLLSDAGEYQKMANAVNPYGDGKSSARIFTHLREFYKS